MSGAVAAQMEIPLNTAVDPFSIRHGSTFSASGESATKPARITNDIREARDLIIRNHIGGDTSGAGLTKTALGGMLRSLDPHSNFYDANDWKEMLDEQSSGYAGIGATIADFENSGVTDTYILSTFPGSPAARSQLRYGDKIVEIDGEEMTGKELDFVRDRIRGPVGTKFRLTLERAATNQIETVEIRRSMVPQPSIPDAYILLTGVGYIDLSEGFNFTTSDEFDDALRKLKRSGMKSLILDLRGNGGGIVEQAVKVAAKFLPSGTLILTQRGRTRFDNRVWKSTNANPEQMPLVVLVNEETASASEIVAGAFQDDDRALIVGQKTFGKGLVQSVIDLPGRTGLTLTTARYLTPSGRSIQRDYSKMDLYDYFNHKNSDAEIDRPYFETRTVTNRKVFGGDGIQPDETVKTQEITRSQAAMLDPIFAFTRELVNGRIAGHENYRAASVSAGKRVTPSDFPVSESVLISFNDFALNSNEKLSAEHLNSLSEFIKLQLRYHVIAASFGTVTANQILIENDIQAAKAIATLPKSAQLTESAKIARNQQK